MKNKVVLAYSGGLDTSYCIKYLSAELGFEVHALTVNTGSFNSVELDEMQERAFALGATSFYCIDAIERFYSECLRFLVYGNVLRNRGYPLSVSAERVFQARELAKYARNLGVQSVAHGSTGAGNDQVRFDLALGILCPEIQIITPIRDQKLSRQEEVDYLAAHGFNWNWDKAKYSVNQGIWGTTVGGEETLTSEKALPSEAYPSEVKETEEEIIELDFVKGELVDIDGMQLPDPISAINLLETKASQFAIGRGVHVGDTIIGIKGRVGYEAAGPLIIIKAHHLLESHVLTKWQSYWKEQLGNWYGMLLHEGQFLDPVMRNIEAFLADTQANVTGTVIVKLYPNRFELVGVRSDFDLMQASFGSYGEMNNAWDGSDVKGFTKILANQTMIHQSIMKKMNV